jgi:hypothetical protein
VKSTAPIILSISSLLVAGCATEIGPDGRQRSVMTPMGAAVLQTATAAGIGAGTGAIMGKNANPVAVGAVSAGAGSIGSQAINTFVPKAGQQPQYQQQPVQQQQQPEYFFRNPDGRFVPATATYVQQPDGTYVPSYPPGRKIFQRLPNGAFAPVQ